jgi:hypothetical protein
MSLADQYRIFYSCESSRDHVPNDKPVSYPLDTIIDMAMQLLQDDGDFLGILNEADVCVQFMALGGGMIEIDIPDPPRRGSHSKSIRENELEAQVKNVASLFSPQRIGFKFSAW